MKTYNYELGTEKLQELLDIPYLLSQKNILIQIFCGSSKDLLQIITKELEVLLPHAITIGATTDGEIRESSISTKKTVISVSVFDKTTVNSTHVNNKDSFKNGVDLATKLINKKTKLLIVFTDGTTTNGEEFLKGIESVDNSIIIAGGMAGDNGCFIQTFISEGSSVLEKGAVGVSLDSDSLYIHNNYSFNWNPIGVEHTIDRVEANRVYRIDGIAPVDFYTKYLGDDVASKLPATGIEFPLIMEKNGIKTARAVIAKHKDGSLSFAGNLNIGDRVRFGFANMEMIIDDPLSSLQKFCNTPIETFFLYSCMARRRYMPELIQVEVEPFASLAPTAGFFTYGEFYHLESHNELLNQTLTVVALSESKDKNILDCLKSAKKENNFDDYATTIKALTHLVQQSSKDLEELLIKQKLFLRHAVHETVTPLSAIMSSVELHGLEYGKNEHLSNIEVAMKNVFNIYDDLAYLVKNDQLNYPPLSIDLVDYVRSRIDFFMSLALKANLQLEFDIKIDKAIINFNQTKLQRIIDNNLTNAIKYTKEGETISVLVDSVSYEYMLQIKSKSAHIQNKEKIFTPYYREENSIDGFGLGLNLVKQICDEEGVSIELSSSADITSFTYMFKGGNI